MVLHNIVLFILQKKVIETKSVEFMPLPLSLSSLLVSLLWMTYGLLIRDIFVAVCTYSLFASMKT